VRLILLPFILLAVVAVLIYVPPVQNFLRKKAVSILAEKTGADVRLEHLALRFPIGLSLEGLFVGDQQGDTLLYAGTLKARLGMRALMDKRIVLGGVVLEEVRATVAQSADSTFNFDFILDGLAGTDTTTTPKDTSGGWDFSIESVDLRNIVLDLRLDPSDLFLDLHLGELEIDLDLFQLDPMRFHVDELLLKDTRIAMRTVSGPPTPGTYPALTNPLDSLDIRFNGIVLENVAFTLKTSNTGDSLWMEAPFAELVTETIDLTKQQLDLEELTLRGFRFGMLSTGPSPKDTSTAAPPWLDQHDGFRYFLKDWDLKAQEVRISESEFAMHNGRIAKPDSLLDMDHLVVTDLRLTLNELVVNNDRIAAQIEDLSATTGPQNTALQLTTTIEASPAEMALSAGSVTVDGTTITFDAHAAPGDLSAFHRTPNEVPLRLRARTVLDLQELKPMLASLGISLPTELRSTETYATTIRVAGTVQHMDTLSLTMTGDQGTALAVNGRIANASAWPNTAFVVDLDRFTMGRGLRETIMAFVPAGTKIPRSLEMRLHANGLNGRVVGDIDLRSDFGDIVGGLTANGLDSVIPDAFSLDFHVNDLRLSRITGDTTIGPLSFALVGEGSHMNTATRSAHVEIVPSGVSFNGNDISTLRVVADAEGDSLYATVNVESEPLTLDLGLRGTWPEPGDSLRAVLEMTLANAELETLGFLPYPLNVEGNWSGKATFSSEGKGSADLIAEGLRLSNERSDFVFEHFAAHAFLGSDSTAVELDSDALTLTYNTNIAADSILPRSRDKLATFFSADTAFHPAPGKYMDLAITLPRSEWLTDLVVPGLRAIQLETFTGRYDSDTDELHLDIVLPFLDYDSTRVNDLVVNIDAVGPKLNGSIGLQRGQHDQFYVEGLTVDAVTAGGVLTTTLNVVQDEVERYRIGTELRSENDMRLLHIRPELVLNGKAWTADPQNVLRFGSNAMEAEHFTLSSGAEQVQLITDAEHLTIALRQFQLGTMARIVSTTDSIPLTDGRIDGQILLPTDDTGLLSAELTIDDLHFLATELGTLTIDLQQPQRDQYAAKVDLSHTSNRLNALANITTGTTTDVDASVDLDLKDLSFLKPFVDEYLYDLSGGVKGDVAYRVQNGKTTMNGELNFVDAGIGVEMTGARYTLANERLTMDDAGAHFQNFILRDTLGNTFSLDGDVGMADPARPQLDLRFRTEKFQMINSTFEQNELFYGDLFARMDLRITGPAFSPLLKGEIGVLPGTIFSVVLPGSKVDLVDAQGIVIFTDDLTAMDTLSTTSDSEVMRDSLKAQLPGVALDLAISVDKQAEFAIVLDPTTGDQATFSGSGDLVFRYQPDGEMFLSGPFVVDKGGYTLEFYGLVKKRFELVQGSSVRWSGDPIKAAMDIRARYTSDSAPLPLVATANANIPESERNRLQQPLPFSVIIAVGGAVNDPKIDFAIDLSRDLRNSYPQVSARLDQLAQPGNVDERNKQVFGLLVMNSFIQDEAAGGPPSSGIATSAARNSVNGLLTDQMNKLTGKFIKGVDISLGVNTYDQASGTDVYQRTSVDYKVSKEVLDERLSFEVGGSVGVDEQNNEVSNVSNTRTAQYAILYDLTKDGRYRIRGFHEPAFDIYDGEITTSGVALMYTKDFEENERARAARREKLRQRREEEAKKKEPEDGTKEP
jgi:hypothetical protein